MFGYAPERDAARGSGTGDHWAEPERATIALTADRSGGHPVG